MPNLRRILAEEGLLKKTSSLSRGQIDTAAQTLRDLGFEVRVESGRGWMSGGPRIEAYLPKGKASASPSLRARSKEDWVSLQQAAISLVSEATSVDEDYLGWSPESRWGPFGLTLSTS
jgi:hypothetical protein